MPKKPSKVFKQHSRTITPKVPIPGFDPQFDAPAFDEFLRNRGLRWFHEKAALCPNVRDLEAQDHDPNCKGCDRGYMFFGGIEVMGAHYGGRLEKMYEVQGVWDIGQAVVTFQSFTDGPDGEPGEGTMVDMQVGDRLTCLDYSFTWQELIESSPTGIDRLRYPAITVEYIATKDRKYTEGVHFEITDMGDIKWLTQDRPKYELNLKRGGIYTIVYTARPVFFVVQLMHEIRATKGIDRKSKELVAIRLPQQVLLRRDFMIQHPGDSVGQEDVPQPRDGRLPPS